MHDKDDRWVANVKRQQYLYPWEKGWATAPRCNCKWAGARRRAPWIVLGPELLASSSTSVGEPGSGPAPAILNLQSVLVFGKWFLEPFCGSGWQGRCSRLGSKVLFYLCIQKSISGRSKGLFSWASAGSCPQGGREGNGMWTCNHPKASRYSQQLPTGDSSIRCWRSSGPMFL